MTCALAADENNDLFIGPDGNLAVIYDLWATLQAVQQAAQTMLGEMEYATDQGMPNFTTIWNGSPQVAQFEASLRRAVLAVAHVIGIADLVITVEDNILSYTMTVITDYGVGVV